MLRRSICPTRLAASVRMKQTAKGSEVTRPVSDADLREAVVAQHSWRGVLRALGLPENASRHARVLRDRAVALGIDVTHFRGHRSWSDAQLISAVPAANDWTELMQKLGYPADSGSARNTIRGHCARIGISPSHLDVSAGDDPPLPRSPAAAGRLRSAGPMLVAAYLTLEGYRVSWPLEPALYDLLVTQRRRRHRECK